MADDDEVALPSGRRITANNGIVGLTASGDIGNFAYGGYDARLHVIGLDEDGDQTWERPTKAELVEVADLMIARWTEARAKWIA